MDVVMRNSITALSTVIFLCGNSGTAAAQGCEPIRFTTPVNLGGQAQAYQPEHEWQLTLAYRRLVSNEWFVGQDENSALAPGGKSPEFRIHTFVADVAYSINDRYRVKVSVPLSSGTLTRTWPDKAVHEQTATGVGDLTVMAEGWALKPRTHERGNIAFGVGVKIPTGSHTIASQFHTAAGPVDFPADQTIQPGDGGWAAIVESRAFRQISERTHAYALASYMMSPKARSDVQWVPESGQYWSVPDVYSARLGGAFSVLRDQGLTMSLGARIDGIPLRDLQSVVAVFFRFCHFRIRCHGTHQAADNLVWITIAGIGRIRFAVR